MASNLAIEKSRHIACLRRLSKGLTRFVHNRQAARLHIAKALDGPINKSCERENHRQWRLSA